MKKKRRKVKHDTCMVALFKKNTQSLHLRIQMLHRRGVSGVSHRRTHHKLVQTPPVCFHHLFINKTCVLHYFPRSQDGSALFVIHSPSEPIRQGLSSCLLHTAGKWISIYGSVSLIVAHSFLSGPQSTSQAEPEMG